MHPTKFHFTKFRLWDAIYFILYVTVTILLWYYVFMESDERMRKVVLGYAVITQIQVYVLGYKSLRSALSWSLWLLVGVFHLLLYFGMKNDHFATMYGSNAATPLRNTLVMVVLFQVLRYVSFNIQRRDLICPARGGRDMLGEVNTTKADLVLFAFYHIVLFGLMLFE